MIKPLMILTGLSAVLTLLTLPLATHMEPESGGRLCFLAGSTCFVAGLAMLSLPLLPVADTYLMVVTLGFGVRMLLPLICCGVLMKKVGIDEARVFAICLLVISPVLLFWETWSWIRRLDSPDSPSKQS